LQHKQEPKEGTMSDQNDTRTFEATFRKPTRVRIEHNGKTVYDQVLDGHNKITLSEIGVPYVGITTLYLDEAGIAQWEVE
jgi:hypothetical protein